MSIFPVISHKLNPVTVFDTVNKHQLALRYHLEFLRTLFFLLTDQ